MSARGSVVRYRPGESSDIARAMRLTDDAAERAMAENAVVGPAPDDPERGFVEFLAAQPDARFWIGEQNGELAGFARAIRFGAVDHLTALEVHPDHQGHGIGRGLLERCWPGDPTPDVGRVAVSSGAPAALGLYADFGVMPAAGHWLLEHRAEGYLAARARELDESAAEAVAALSVERARAEWARLEPTAVGHPRPQLHEYFLRERTCLACFDQRSEGVTGLCWVGPTGQIGPAVGAQSEDLVPVVLAALDRVSRMEAADNVCVHTTTIAWWLLRRLLGLGFEVRRPAWVMSSTPLPGLDRYAPTRPAQIL